MQKYADRQEAGRVLAEHLKHYANRQHTIVLGLPRGGVPVAYEIAKALFLPLDVFIVRKLGVPGHEELALGAMASGGVTVFNEEIIRDLHISKTKIDHVIENEKKEIERREIKYRGSRPFPDLSKKTIILIDDGIATGATMRAAIASLKAKDVARLVVAVPVAAGDTCQQLTPLVDEFVCPLRPENFYAVGAWYEDFAQTSDDEVAVLMKT